MYIITSHPTGLAAMISVSTFITAITLYIGLIWFVVFNATFKNISAISWRSVLLMEETGVSIENHQPVASH